MTAVTTPLSFTIATNRELKVTFPFQIYCVTPSYESNSSQKKRAKIDAHILQLNDWLNKACKNTFITSLTCTIKYVGTYKFRVALKDLDHPLVLNIKAQNGWIPTNNNIALSCMDIQSSFGMLVCSPTESNESGTPSERTNLGYSQQLYGQNSRGTSEHDNSLSVTFEIKPSDLNWKATVEKKRKLAITNSLSGFSNSIDVEIKNPNGDGNGDVVCWFDNGAKQILVYGEAYFDWTDEDGELMEGKRKHFYWHDLENGINDYICELYEFRENYSLGTFEVIDASVSNGRQFRCILFVAMESVYLVEFYSGALLKAWPIPNSFIEHVATWQFQQQNEAITVTFTLSNGLKFIHPLLSTGDFVVPHPCNFDWDYSEDFKAYWRDEVHTIRCSSIEDVPKCFGELFGYPPTLFKYNHTEERIEKKNNSPLPESLNLLRFDTNHQYIPNDNNNKVPIGDSTHNEKEHVYDSFQDSLSGGESVNERSPQYTGGPYLFYSNNNNTNNINTDYQYNGMDDNDEHFGM